MAGVNGAGKSSIAGAAFRDKGGDYFNPDEAARAIRAADPTLAQAEANSLAWHQGRRLLERAIDERLDFNLETTLGAGTIPALLARAADAGGEVRIWYVGLEDVERHLARVKARVAAGGHDIPEADIRRRWQRSRENLVWLMPKLAALRVFDNSVDADPRRGDVPQLRLILDVRAGRIVGPRSLRDTPAWAKPIVARALQLQATR